LDTPVKRYSSGMHVRLGFAVAAHLEPDILVVDEVLAVGDAEFQKKAISKMKNISESKGRTVLFVSHNMGSIEKLCSRAVLVENGSITENGPVRQVIATYLKSNLNDRGEKQWNDAAIAPGDEVACLRSIRACNAEGRVLNEFNVTESFYIEVEFSVLKSTHNLNVSLYFSDESGNIIFVTGDFQDKRWQDHVRSRGIHRSRAHIPGNLLNEGTIRILVAIVTNPYTLHALQRDAISIKIRDDYDPDGARGNYTKKWRGGAVRPLLKWSFDFEPLNED